MRRSQRLIATAVLISLCGVLAGCGGGGMSNWDPSDMLDFLDTKKKLPGKREPVFPDGVPGIEQGVPKDLYKSNVEQQQQQEQAAAAAATAPSDESAHAGRSGATAGTTAGAETGAAEAAPRRTTASRSGWSIGEPHRCPRTNPRYRIPRHSSSLSSSRSRQLRHSPPPCPAAASRADGVGVSTFNDNS
jgi:hypothetical protein